MANLPTSRAAARELGVDYYRSDHACPKGHVNPVRRASNGTCYDCCKVRRRERYARSHEAQLRLANEPARVKAIWDKRETYISRKPCASCGAKTRRTKDTKCVSCVERRARNAARERQVDTSTAAEFAPRIAAAYAMRQHCVAVLHRDHKPEDLDAALAAVEREQEERMRA